MNYKEREVVIQNNLIKIRDWCKELMKNEERELRIIDAYVVNRRGCNVYVRQNDGLIVRLDGKYTNYLGIYDDDCDNPSYRDKLEGSIAEQLIIQWPKVKNQIMDAYNELKKRDEELLNFEP